MVIDCFSHPHCNQFQYYLRLAVNQIICPCVKQLIFLTKIRIIPMITQFNNTFVSMLLAVTVAVASGAVEAGKGSGNGGGSSSSGSYGSGYGSGNSAMYGPGQTTGQGYETRNSNQYRHQNQHRYHNGNGSAQGNRYSADPGKSQFSSDKYLNQKDFQAWLNQSQSKTQNKAQNQNQVQNMDQDGL